MKLRLSEIRAVCLSHPGMWDDFLRAGQSRGQDLEISRSAFDKISDRYFGNALGTGLHKLVKPIAGWLDSVTGLSLADCGKCAERQLKLNELTIHI